MRRASSSTLRRIICKEARSSSGKLSLDSSASTDVNTGVRGVRNS